MKSTKTYYVYIISNRAKTTLYVGVTNDLARRLEEHKDGLIRGFSKKYNLHDLVYYEEFNNILEAIAREKRLKKWNREWKNELVSDFNPKWEDLSKEL